MLIKCCGLWALYNGLSVRTHASVRTVSVAAFAVVTNYFFGHELICPVMRVFPLPVRIVQCALFNRFIPFVLDVCACDDWFVLGGLTA